MLGMKVVRRIAATIIVLFALSAGFVLWGFWYSSKASTESLVSCVEAELPLRSWICYKALFWVHPRPEELRRLNQQAGAYFIASMESEELARLVLRHYVDAGLDINAVDQRSASGPTALHISVTSNRPQEVRLLLEAGADPSIRNHLGKTPLEHALDVQSRHQSSELSEVIQILEAAQ